MDIFAHALWANVGARKGNQVLENKGKPKFSIAWATFWGIFPDLAAFSIPYFLRFWLVLQGQIAFLDFFKWPPVRLEGAYRSFSFTGEIYPFSHSFIIFGIVFIIAWIIWRRPRWELLGWALHIFIDIFTHAATGYPTPFLFPISDFRFLYGIAWSKPWFIIANYSALLLIWGRSLISNSRE